MLRITFKQEHDGRKYENLFFLSQYEALSDGYCSSLTFYDESSAVPIQILKLEWIIFPEVFSSIRPYADASFPRYCAFQRIPGLTYLTEKIYW